MTFAVVRGVPDAFVRALSKEPPPAPFDVARARAQHRGYVAALRRAGAEVLELPPDEAYPDCCFVEDTAVVAGGLALITRPGAPSRQGETAAMRAALAPRLPVRDMAGPASLDGGDCMLLGARLYVGRSGRTNAEGVAHARAVFRAVGVEVIEVEVPEGLHLKSSCSPLGSEVVLAAPGSFVPTAFAPARLIEVPAGEAPAANAVTVGAHALVAAGFPETARLVAAAGFTPIPVDNSELRKADSALTCLSVLVPPLR